jgi:TonB-linked SusC/RagA family outer membrane protein
LSGNYYDQDGILINTGVQRGSIRLNLDHEVNERVTMGVNLTLARKERFTVPIDNGNFGGKMYTDALSAPPTLPVYDDNGVYTRIEQIYSFGSLDMRNPLIHSEPRRDRSLANSVLANTSLDVKIVEGLTFKTLFGIEYQNTINEDFIPLIFPADQGFAADGYDYRNSFLNENVLNYSKIINDKHSLSVVGGFTNQSYLSRFAIASVRGLANNITENYDLSGAEIVNAPSNGISEWSLLSWLGRVNYSFKDRYLITASIRSDGSSRFGANNKWVSEEPFMEAATFIYELKVRASYGITGNSALSPYQSLDRLRSIRIVEGNNTDVIGYVPDGLANSELKWETTAQTDIGFDLSLLEGKIDFTFDYYKKNTSNLLASVPLPPSVGFGSVLQNIGEIQNEGLEFAVNANIINTDFKWDIFAQVSTNKNKVIKLAGDSDIFGSANGHPFNSTINIARVGEPLGVFYGFVEDGLDDNGFIQYVDTDGNGVVNSLDRVILGSPYPDVIYGINNNFSYKNFELNIFLEGVQGNQIFWETAGVHLNSFQRGQNQFADLAGNYWTEDNPDLNAKYPKISSGTNVQVSDRYVKDGSFLRVRAFKLAYNIPVDGLAWCDRAQIYISGNNLFTFTNYPGIDPEANTAGNDSQNIGSRLLVGIDESAYPLAKILSLGVKASF